MNSGLRFQFGPLGRHQALLKDAQGRPTEGQRRRCHQHGIRGKQVPDEAPLGHGYSLNR